MRKNIILYIVVFLFICSLTGLTFNFLNYNTKLSKQKKYEADITNVKKSIDDSNAKLDELKSKYETLNEENSKSIENYKEWQRLNEEIKEYLQ